MTLVAALQVLGLRESDLSSGHLQLRARRRLRELARSHHPDHGGQGMERVTAAYARVREVGEYPPTLIVISAGALPERLEDGAATS
jgi:hypothetical protein